MEEKELDMTEELPVSNAEEQTLPKKITLQNLYFVIVQSILMQITLQFFPVFAYIFAGTFVAPVFGVIYNILASIEYGRGAVNVFHSNRLRSFILLTERI